MRENSITDDTWLSYFEQLFSHDNNATYENEHIFDSMRTERDDSELDAEITEDEIIDSVRSLRGSCATGLDGICVEMFKNSIGFTLPFIKHIFNRILDSGSIPSSWCESIIVPVHKKGSINDPNNYRAISIANTFSKIFMKILSKRLTSWAELNGAIDEAQAGFRHGYSTIDDIFVIQSIVQKYLSKQRGRMYVFYIDFLKAYDNCEHHKLWDCLIRNGIREDGKFLGIFKNMYKQLKSCVKVRNGLTGFFQCEKATKQGCVSSSIIFTLFINDLVKYISDKCHNGIFLTEQINNIHAILFADDVASCADTVVNLQNQINCVSDFCEASGMSINIDKSKIMVFRNGGYLRRSEKWHYRGQIIETVPFYKYLGSFFTTKLSWTKTVNTLSLQATKAVHTIYKYQTHFGYFSLTEMFKIFDAMVTPILVYSSEVWGTRYYERIEKIQINFCKRIAGLNQNVTNFLALTECGRLPLSCTYMSRSVKYWAKLTQMNSQRYPKQCYIMLRRLDSAGKTNWATHIKHLLFQNGFGYVWLTDEVADIKLFVSIFKTRLTDCSYQWLNENIQTSPKCLAYKLFKSALTPETYLTVPISYKFKRVLANFRCSGHNLMIEKGRHLKIDREFRFCEHCTQHNIYVIENEMHFLIECPLYSDLREAYFPTKWVNRTDSDHLFVEMLTDTSYANILALSKFLYSAFEKKTNC